jgi:hypothetical protein
MKTNREKALDLRELLENSYGFNDKDILDYILINWMSGDEALEAINTYKTELIG